MYRNIGAFHSKLSFLVRHGFAQSFGSATVLLYENQVSCLHTSPQCLYGPNGSRFLKELTLRSFTAKEICTACPSNVVLDENFLVLENLYSVVHASKYFDKAYPSQLSLQARFSSWKSFSEVSGSQELRSSLCVLDGLLSDIFFEGLCSSVIRIPVENRVGQGLFVAPILDTVSSCLTRPVLSGDSNWLFAGCSDDFAEVKQKHLKFFEDCEVLYVDHDADPDKILEICVSFSGFPGSFAELVECASILVA